MATTKETKRTVAALARERAHVVRAKVCNYLGWKEQFYYEHQLEQYEDFFKIMFSGFPEIMMNEIRYSPIMAGYWKNEWAIRNERDFLPIAEEELDTRMWVDELGNLETYEPTIFNKSMVEEEYLFCNSAKTLIEDDYFMAGYNEALKLIRHETKRLQRV